MQRLKTRCALLALCGLMVTFAIPQVAAAQDRRGYYTDHRLDIPAGHYPPPGDCKLWFLDRPAGQQPPPTDCRNLLGRPLGNAVVLHHEGVFDPYYRYEDRRVIPRILREIFGGEDDEEYEEAGYDDDYDDRDAYVAPRAPQIGAGHFPPRGRCRLWYVDRPEDRQPEPVACRKLYGRNFDEDELVLYNGRVWDPYATYDVRTVPDVILRMFQ